MTDWKKYKLSDITEGIYDCPHSTPKWTGKGVFVIRNFNVKNGRLDLEKSSYTDEIHYKDRVRRAVPNYGDIVLTREAPMGEVCMIPKGLKCCLGQRVVLIRPDKKKANPNFILYSFQSPIIQDQIKVNEGTGSVVSNLRIPYISDLSFPLPDLTTQTRIASILSALDDKIELNRRMNHTLEQMAQALFKKYFVTDIDPDNLPDGWRWGKVGDVCRINSNTLSKADQLKWINYIEISEVSSGYIGSIARYQRGKEPSRARRKLRHGDTVLSTVRPDRGSYFLAINPDRELVVSTGFAVFTPTEVPYSYLYLLLTQEEFVKYYGFVAHGAAYPAINPEIILSMEIPLAPEYVFEKFHKIAEPLLLKFASNNIESKGLSKIRDSLLPKLMNGEIEVL